METANRCNEKESGLSIVKSETYAVIDGLNMAFARNDGIARLSDLFSIYKYASTRYDKIDIIIDASARYRIDDKTSLENLIRKRKIVLGPAGIDGDDLIWLRARSLYEKGNIVSIISNDMFPVRRSIQENIPVESIAISMFQDGEIYFLKRTTRNKNKDTMRSLKSIVHLVEVKA
jgi:hypothetical protein